MTTLTKYAPSLLVIGLCSVAFVGPPTPERSAMAVLAAHTRSGPVPSPTSAYASAALGKLTLTSAVLLSDTGAQLLAGWQSAAAGCGATRRLVVDTTIEYVPSGGPTRRARTFRLDKTGAVTNCGESGPSFGFGFSARHYHLSCPDGTWLPGTYSFSTTAIVAAPGGLTPDVTLRSVADLHSTKAAPCR